MTARYNGGIRAKANFPSRAAPVPAAAVSRRLRAPSFPLGGKRAGGVWGRGFRAWSDLGGYQTPLRIAIVAAFCGGSRISAAVAAFWRRLPPKERQSRKKSEPDKPAHGANPGARGTPRHARKPGTPQGTKGGTRPTEHSDHADQDHRDKEAKSHGDNRPSAQEATRHGNHGRPNHQSRHRHQPRHQSGKHHAGPGKPPQDDNERHAPPRRKNGHSATTSSATNSRPPTAKPTRATDTGSTPKAELPAGAATTRRRGTPPKSTRAQRPVAVRGAGGVHRTQKHHRTPPAPGLRRVLH